MKLVHTANDLAATEVTVGVFGAQGQKLAGQLQDLLDRNQAKTGNGIGFIINGNIRSPFPEKVYRRHAIKPIDPSLHAEADVFDAAATALTRDTNKFSQLVSIFAMRCFDLQSFRDALPEAAAKHSESLMALSRTRVDGDFARQHQNLWKAYQTIEEIALRYEAYQLIY